MEKNLKMVDIDAVELFLMGHLKELPQGYGKCKLVANCSLEKFLDDLERELVKNRESEN